jgi:hypothetical protein
MKSAAAVGGVGTGQGDDEEDAEMIKSVKVSQIQ